MKLKIFLWLLLIHNFEDVGPQYYQNTRLTSDWWSPIYMRENKDMAEMLAKLMKEVMDDGRDRVSGTYKIRQDNMRSAAYEVGYLTQIIREKYRQMISIYDATMMQPYNWYLSELVLYLEDVEHLYWSLKHICNMLHEIERKYNVTSGLDEEYKDVWIKAKQPDKGLLYDPDDWVITTPSDLYAVTKTRSKRMKIEKKIAQWLANTTTLRPTGELPIQYGTTVSTIDPNSELLQECSWSLKLRLLKDVPSIAGNDTLASVAKETGVKLPISDMYGMPDLSGYQLTTPRQRLYSTLPHMHYLHPGTYPDRRVGIEHLRRQFGQEERERKKSDASTTLDPVEEKMRLDEYNMRLKLFRLMYETVRDSDLKVKRAELIKDHYVNSTSFELGYLVGDITDKNNIIQDIAETLRRFYKEWKPIEHINAYEQIANQAIEITHLTDLVKIVAKRNAKPATK